MIIPISKEILNDFDLINQEFLVDEEHYSKKAGVQEYRLYSYLSTFFNDTIILDIGTLKGRSAVALSYNEKNRVISYDLVNHIFNYNHPIYTKSNIRFKIKDVLEDLTEELIKKVKIVMIDIDHYETVELQIINRLKELQFNGIILLDDIKNHPDLKMKTCMKKLWDGILDKKYDLTKYGHWSGTGVIIIGDDVDFTFLD
jgi:predicted O-methyltransferase YrrM